MNNDFLKWLEQKRATNNRFYSVYEICRAVKKAPTTQVYRQFNRAVAYGLLDFKYVQERHAIVYRRKKTK
ncbi:MAG: hypothetical protein GY853_02230 [PVC group bacterium]|nr:hypothetical protein [PVC group bacterium]